MKKEENKNLPDSSFIILALLSEGKTHGYELEKTVHNRGFKFWTKLGRSSIYGSLRALEKTGFVKMSLEQKGGPARKMFAITKKGMERLRKESIEHLSKPSHWRSEIDLGIYTLPLLTPTQTKKSIDQCLETLEMRLKFIEERASWCKKNNLDLPTLTFERTQLMLEAELKWVKSLQKKLNENKTSLTFDGWKKYEYEEPPEADNL